MTTDPDFLFGHLKVLGKRKVWGSLPRIGQVTCLRSESLTHSTRKRDRKVRFDSQNMSSIPARVLEDPEEPQKHPATNRVLAFSRLALLPAKNLQQYDFNQRFSS